LSNFKKENYFHKIVKIKASPLGVLEGEAMALIEAMEEVVYRGYSYVIFESDSQLVVDAISSRQVGV
jgi:hypothetical protein